MPGLAASVPLHGRSSIRLALGWGRGLEGEPRYVTLLEESMPTDCVYGMQAMVDFEEDVPDSDMPRMQQRVQEMAQGVQQALDTATRGRLLTAGLQVTSPPSPLLPNPCLCTVSGCCTKSANLRMFSKICTQFVATGVAATLYGGELTTVLGCIWRGALVSCGAYLCALRHTLQA